MLQSEYPKIILFNNLAHSFNMRILWVVSRVSVGQHLKYAFNLILIQCPQSLLPLKWKRCMQYVNLTRKIRVHFIYKLFPISPTTNSTSGPKLIIVMMSRFVYIVDIYRYNLITQLTKLIILMMQCIPSYIIILRNNKVHSGSPT